MPSSLSLSNSIQSWINQWPKSGPALDWIKLWAAILMVWDHWSHLMHGHADWGFIIGRGVFPLFCYAMACHINRGVPLSRYIGRMAFFAVITQPIYMWVFDKVQLNIIFTLMLGAFAAHWLGRQSSILRNGIFAVGLFGIILKISQIEYGIMGILLPAVFAAALSGKRGGWLWLVVFLLFININIKMETIQQLSAPGYAITLVVIALATLGVTAIILFGATYFSTAQTPQKRLLPKYFLYIFYPAHLIVLKSLKFLLESCVGCGIQ